MLRPKYAIFRQKMRIRPAHWPIASRSALAHGAIMTTPSPLDDPENARFAWARYKRLMRFMVAITLLVTSIAMALLYWFIGAVSIHFYIATGLGIAVAMMLTAALMGLVFLSNGTGHDESIADPTRDERWN